MWCYTLSTTPEKGRGNLHHHLREKREGYDLPRWSQHFLLYLVSLLVGRAYNHNAVSPNVINKKLLFKMGLLSLT